MSLPGGRGIVYLVGAGPGDPELITVRGLRCLRQADVVVYDRLVDPRLLDEAPPAARRVYAGKSSGRQALRQEEINALLVRQARAGRVVVRLKGGDPFVFGRGGEEALACAAAGVAWEVVPGLTSAVAVPGLAGIPLTHRGVAASFAVVTGHQAGEERAAGTDPQGAPRLHAGRAPSPSPASPDPDWAALAGLDTLVVLMGAARLAEIAALLLRHGKSPSTPAAVVENGTREDERVLVGTLSDIAQVAAAVGLRSPATLIVGEVVRLRAALAPPAAAEDRHDYGPAAAIV
jgi:uroporphyrin-III C-methyltransferase